MAQTAEGEQQAMNMNANANTAVTLKPSLLGLMLLSIGLALYLVLSPVYLIVCVPMLLISALALYLTYQKSFKIGALVAACGTIVLHVVLLLTNNSDKWFPVLLHLLWLFAMLGFCKSFRGAVDSLLAERDFLRAENKRIAVVDDLSQMRNLRAYLNDAPIYMKMAKRYHLSMVVLVWRLNNAPRFARELHEMVYSETIRAVSSSIRRSVRLEDLTYMIDEKHSIWGMVMFTNGDHIQVIIDRIQHNLDAMDVKNDEGEVLRFDVSYGYEIYNTEEEIGAQTLLDRACAKVL